MMTSVVPFEYMAHLLTIPVTVCGVDTRFIFDTGIGPNLISEDFAVRVGCHRDGSTFTGQRMSGQAVTMPLGSLDSLQIGATLLRDVRAGIFDMQAMAGLSGVEGFVSLSFFRATPVTVHYSAGVLILEDEASLAERAVAGTSVTVQVDYDDCSTDLLLGLDLPSGKPISVEVDTGTDVLILNERLADDAGIDLRGEEVQKVEGRDETGHEFVRYFTELRGDVQVSGAPSIRMTNPQVQVQQIIYDGLVGDRFLRHFTTTYDLARSRVIFAIPH